MYACAFVGIIFWARVADITNARGLTLAASSFTSVLGYALLMGLTGDKEQLAATCIIAFGAYPNIVLTLSWLSISIVGYTKRSVRIDQLFACSHTKISCSGSALAFINTFSQLVAIAGNQAYSDPPLCELPYRASYMHH